MPEERRVDPADGKAYLLSEVLEMYKRKYFVWQIRSYWSTEMKEELRFDVGDRVLCNVGERRIGGVVTKTDVSAKEFVYLVQTDPLPSFESNLLAVPRDDDDTCCRERCFHESELSSCTKWAAPIVSVSERKPLRFSPDELVSIRIWDTDDGYEQWANAKVLKIWPSLPGPVLEGFLQSADAVPYKVDAHGHGIFYCHRDDHTLLRLPENVPRIPGKRITPRFELRELPDGKTEKFDNQTLQSWIMEPKIIKPHTSKRGKGDKLPVIVLTGYLGAGKTTLLNYLLKEQRDKKLAVIENEVGEVSIDGALVEQTHQDMAQDLIVLDNGCVCCTIRGDLVQTLKIIANKNKQDYDLDGVLIELTGAADPAPVVQTFFVDDDVRGAFYVDNVVTLVDAKHAIEMLDESEADREGKGTACAQIAFSSAVLLNKIDLVDSAGLEVIEKRIKEINSAVSITRCQEGRVDVSKLFDVGAFQLAKVLDEQYMDEEEFNQFYKSKMDRSISNVGVLCTGALNMVAFQKFLNKYLSTEEDAKDFLRVKGVLDIEGSDKQYVLQCVHMIRNQGFTKPWGKEHARENRIIFIGRNMKQRRQELTEGFMACIAKNVTPRWDEFDAYRIKLLNGDEVQAPVDDDCFVMVGQG
eukprot:CAMPEP_0172688188 /NCGR_PEP_ID=MMETSP1074-20121228/22242_1 /TAXON_ID=2916 /ORGANISM="Ceratium fusus, Strain PA161109" /LENGTH=637 /DNA_ID=CAMNT_0013507795 /DNA_START=61 /DNA_END=1975 /DNA_ORIENTATION=-